MPTLVEIKARCGEPETVRNILKEHKALFKGVDHQIDTYFKVKHGRLKLREGNIENHLIHYFRKNQEGPKKSKVLLYKNKPDSSLKEILTTANGVLTVVEKKREIYFIQNVKFHIDIVEQLGTFMEIEAIDTDGSISELDLLKQCRHYMRLLNVREADLLKNSYSDMLIVTM